MLLCRQHSLNRMGWRGGNMLNTSKVANRNELREANAAAPVVLRGREIGRLPTFVLYNIMEFMHWDWVQAAPSASGGQEEGRLHGRAVRGARAEQRMREALQLISSSQVHGTMSATAAAMYEGLIHTLFGNNVAGEEEEDEDFAEDDDDDEYEEAQEDEFYDSMDGDEEGEDEYKDAIEGSASDSDAVTNNEAEQGGGEEEH